MHFATAICWICHSWAGGFISSFLCCKMWTPVSQDTCTYSKTPSINAQCQSMRINAITRNKGREVFRINVWILIGVDRHWAMIKGVLIFLWIVRSIPYFAKEKRHQFIVSVDNHVIRRRRIQINGQSLNLIFDTHYKNSIFCLRSEVKCIPDFF